jgi:hypothetical protein
LIFYWVGINFITGRISGHGALLTGRYSTPSTVRTNASTREVSKVICAQYYRPKCSIALSSPDLT